MPVAERLQQAIQKNKQAEEKRQTLKLIAEGEKNLKLKEVRKLQRLSLATKAMLAEAFVLLDKSVYNLNPNLRPVGRLMISN